ncbi:MAG: hypothetical protein II887_08050 [Bacteroidales bacterium]|nr:hypothetical protein [Bacteroidales bacterium]
MKRINLQIGSILMALHLLVVSMGVNVNFHYCTEDHHLTSSLGDASKQCAHCVGHRHMHGNSRELEYHLAERHFDAQCCCKDFNETIGFTDIFTFSTEKSLSVFLPFTLLADSYRVFLKENPVPFFRFFSKEKIPYLLTGRLKTIFFSSLKLNPLVF